MEAIGRRGDRLFVCLYYMAYVTLQDDLRNAWWRSCLLAYAQHMSGFLIRRGWLAEGGVAVRLSCTCQDAAAALVQRVVFGGTAAIGTWVMLGVM